MSDRKTPKPSDYKVGYGRPPKATQFGPGNRANPRGRPRGIKNMTTLFHEALSKKIEITENGKLRKVPVREAIVLRITNQALKGDPKAISMIFAKEPEITAAVERANIQRITEDMTPKEAMELYLRTIRGD